MPKLKQSIEGQLSRSERAGTTSIRGGLLATASAVVISCTASPALAGETTVQGWTLDTASVPVGGTDPQRATNTLPSGLQIEVVQTESLGLQGQPSAMNGGGGEITSLYGVGSTGTYSGPVTNFPPAAGAVGMWTGRQGDRCATGVAGTTKVTEACGALTISFNHPVRNPTLHFAQIGGAVDASWQITSGGGFIAPGSSGAQNMVVTSSLVETQNDAGGVCIVGSPGSSVCGSVSINGTSNSYAFSVRNTYYGATIPLGSTGIDGFRFQVSLDQDFGDAPASYDAGAAAAHILSNLQIGSGVTPDANTIFYSAAPTSSPLSNATASGDTDNGLGFVPDIISSRSTYQLTVPVSGLSKAATLCGWIDFNRNGVFDSGEKACSSPSAGASSAQLSWTLPNSSTIVHGASFMRLRLGYNATQMNSPTGLADSGEVEDYQVTIKAEMPPAMATTTCATGALNVTNNYISWTHNIPLGTYAPSISGTAFPSGANLIPGSGITYTQFNSAYSIGGASELGAANALYKDDTITYQMTTGPGLSSDMVLYSVRLGTYTEPTLYPYRLSVLMSQSPTFTNAALVVDNYQVSSAATSYVQISPTMVMQPKLSPNTTYYFKAIIHDVQSSGQLARWDDFRLDAGRCVIPATLDMTKTSQLYSGNTIPFAVPGSDVVYTLTVSNKGDTAIDTNTVFMLDGLPPEVEFYNGDVDGVGPATDPILFTDSASGLSLSYASNVRYATGNTAPTSFNQCTYTPLAGYDPAVRFICVNPSGSMVGGTPAKSFSIQFRTRIK